MYHISQTELEKRIKDQQELFEQALNAGAEFASLKKIWLELKALQQEWAQRVTASRNNMP